MLCHKFSGPGAVSHCSLHHSLGGGGQHSTFFFLVGVCNTGFQKKDLGHGFSLNYRGLVNKNLENLQLES